MSKLDCWYHNWQYFMSVLFLYDIGAFLGVRFRAPVSSAQVSLCLLDFCYAATHKALMSIWKKYAVHIVGYTTCSI